MFWLIAGTGAALGSETVRVRQVLDGDTVILTDNRHVRLIGINTPELGKKGRPDQPLAQAARDALQDLVGGQPVRLLPGPEPRDRYGRWLARLQLTDGRDPQQVLLAQGLAWRVVMPPNLTGHAADRAAETVARRQDLGVWQEPTYAPRPAESLAAGQGGFMLVRGRIGQVRQSRKYIYLGLSERLTIMVARADWRYFADRPEDWAGRSVIARGWVSPYRDKLRLHIGHPAMLEQIL